MALLSWSGSSAPPEPAAAGPPAGPPSGVVAPPASAGEAADVPDRPAAGPPAPRIAIIIDDVGFRERPILDLARIGLPLTFAILPFQHYSRSLTDKLSASGHEVILHLPMEPEGIPLQDAGEGAVATGMEAGEIARTLERALREVPRATGVSNHMGSRATADPLLMERVLDVVRRRGLYFLDSRTTADTVAFQMARKMGVPALQRAVFLDGRRDESYIEKQFRNLLREARAKGTAVAIGHPYPATIAVLKRSADLLWSEGVRLVPASELAGFGEGGSI